MKIRLLRFLGFNLQMPDIKLPHYDPQAKIRPCERQKSQFIIEYHLYKLKFGLLTLGFLVKKKLKFGLFETGF